MNLDKPAHNFKNIVFPDCSRDCAMIKYLGAGECDSVCPWKFHKETKYPLSFMCFDHDLKNQIVRR